MAIDETLVFLDILVQSKDDSSLEVIVYKSIHTDRYLNFHSHQPPSLHIHTCGAVY